MKKLLSIILIFALVFSCVSCKQKDDEIEVAIPDVSDSDTPKEQTQDKKPVEQKEEVKTPDNDTPVADDEEFVIVGSVNTSCGYTSSDEQTAKKEPLDLLSDSDRQALIDYAGSQAPTVHVEKYGSFVVSVVKNYKFDSAELIKLLAGFKYNEDQYRCQNSYVVIIEGHKFYIDSEYHHVGYGTASHTLTDSEKSQLTDILNKNTIAENFISVEGKQNKVTLTYKKDGEALRYSFMNSDSDMLLMLITEAQMSEGQMPNDPEYEFLLFNGTDRFVMSLQCEKPYVAAGEKIAYLTEEETKQIQSILDTNCVKENLNS